MAVGKRVVCFLSNCWIKSIFKNLFSYIKALTIIFSTLHFFLIIFTHNIVFFYFRYRESYFQAELQTSYLRIGELEDSISKPDNADLPVPAPRKVKVRTLHL